MSGVNYLDRTMAGGERLQITDALNFELSVPVWYAGVPLQRDLAALDLNVPKADYADLRAFIRGISYGPNYDKFQYGDFPAAFTDKPVSLEYEFVAGSMLGTMALLADRDHATEYKKGEHVKTVADVQTLEEEAAITVPAVQPISALTAGGTGWGATVADAGNPTGVDMRAMALVQSNYLGVSYGVNATVGNTIPANPGYQYHVDVTILLTTPPVEVPST